MILPSGSILQGGRYQIERELGHGGFGFTYLATQKGLNRKVAIKEFFMRDYCERDANTSQVSLGTSGSREMIERFRRKFIKEAQNIAMLNHANIIRIYDVFEEHGTAYYVMEYLDRGSLRDLVEKHGKLSEREALFYIKRIASALAYIHERRMNHLDVKPGNVLIDESNNAVLIDFGLAKQYDQEGQQTSTTPVGISQGYAPLEQYQRGGVSVFSPASDIYSLGATLYFLLMGETPPDANMVNDEGLPPLPETLSANVVEAIEKAMHPRRKFRLQSVADFLKILDTTSASVGGVKEVEYKVVDESTQVNNEIFVDNYAYQDAEMDADTSQTLVNLFQRWKKQVVSICAALVVVIAACIVDWGSLFTPSMPSELDDDTDSLLAVSTDTLNVTSGKLQVGQQAIDEAKKEKATSALPQKQQSAPSSSTDPELSVAKNGTPKTYAVKGVVFKMIKVRGGTFKMGATPEQTGAFDSEKPVHRVKLSDYYIGETEVTQELWTAVMGNNPSNFKSNSQLPVENVSWNDCNNFISKLNDLTGENFHLPTEAQWEDAARGGNQSKGYLYSGSNTLVKVAWYTVNSYNKGSSHRDYGTHVVKTKSPNELGLYDMSGNVWEWCQDWYGSYSSAAVSNPKGPASGSSRVSRGGSWSCNATRCRVADRYCVTPDFSRTGLGLRLAL